jgi:hypothetical protein
VDGKYAHLASIGVSEKTWIPYHILEDLFVFGLSCSKFMGEDESAVTELKSNSDVTG